MAIKPWYKVVSPREDLREGKPLDAAEFAVHLDQVREGPKGSAPADYRDPARFFARTYLTRNLTTLSAEVIRRLSGEKTGTSAIFNLATQFGGGKTHALTLLYHLAQHGRASHKWAGVNLLLEKAGVSEVPKAAVAVFVGTEFDSLTGRGGSDGTPRRKTPWGEIAFQLGGEEALVVLAEHERKMTAPSGDVIRQFLPKNKPSLILMDELMNYVSRSRKSGMSAQLYNFLQNLSEVARGSENVVLAVSIPASEMEMTAEDQSDYERYKKVLDRLGKAIVMSAETETSEIIRRRLFEWDEKAVAEDGRVILSKEAIDTCKAFGDWASENQKQLAGQFRPDHAKEAFMATYPFHPALISVFERKWQALPRFQQTRGVLRLLALWVSRAYAEGYKGSHKDPLIGLGTAPLDDSLFRSAAFEQLGETKLEAAVATDICGKKDSHSLRLDQEAPDTIRAARLHRKVATTIFFESNGGQAKAEATQPEIRFAVAEPGIDIGNVETVTEALTEACYYLTVERNRYRFGLRENLNKRFADRRASVKADKIDEYVKAEILKAFPTTAGIDRIPFPAKSSQVPDRPAVTLVILSPEQSIRDEQQTEQLIENMLREYGTSSRTFKSALIFSVPESPDTLREEARKVLAWESIQEEAGDLKLDEVQVRQLGESVKRASRDVREAVWRTYKLLIFLGKDNKLKRVDMGLVHSSAADNMVAFIINRLRQDGDLESGISPNFLARNWPPALKEWPTKSVRDAFYASPQFPRLMSVDAIKDTISRGVANGMLAYVGKTGSGDYKPFLFNQAIMLGDIEISDDVYIISKETAEAYLKAKASGKEPQAAISVALQTEDTSAPSSTDAPTGTGMLAETSSGRARVNTKGEQRPFHSMTWTGDVPSQKWMNFYTKVLSKFAANSGLKLRLTVEVSPEGGVSQQKVEETKAALRELGLGDDINTTS